MLIQKASDIHCEWHRDKGVEWAQLLEVEGDVLALCGDITTNECLMKVMKIICERFSDKKVLYVCGNHEYYNSNRGTIHNKLAKLANKYDNFHHLNNDVVVIDGVRFVGTTLWWHAPPMAWPGILGTLNDFRAIEGYRKWITHASKAARDFLNENVEEGDVVLTHHAPSWLSRHAKHGQQTNIDFAYYNTLDELILEKRPFLWMHGHTHDRTDYTIGDTRVVSFPHGYAFNGKASPERYGVVHYPK